MDLRLCGIPWIRLGRRRLEYAFEARRTKKIALFTIGNISLQKSPPPLRCFARFFLWWQAKRFVLNCVILGWLNRRRRYCSWELPSSGAVRNVALKFWRLVWGSLRQRNIVIIKTSFAQGTAVCVLRGSPCLLLRAENGYATGFLLDFGGCRRAVRERRQRWCWRFGPWLWDPVFRKRIQPSVIHLDCYVGGNLISRVLDWVSSGRFVFELYSFSLSRRGIRSRETLRLTSEKHGQSFLGNTPF